MNKNTVRIGSVIAALGLTLILGSGTSKKLEAKVDSRAIAHYNIDDTKIALGGYSPVSYIENGKAQKGIKKYKSTYKGVKYYFVNASQKKLFDNNPSIYEPAFGGWCAYGFAVEAGKFRADPTKFTVVNGKTLVFLNNIEIDTLALWKKGSDQKQYSKASKYWNKVLN